MIVDEHCVIWIEADGTAPCEDETVLVLETLFEHALLVVDALLLFGRRRLPEEDDGRVIGFVRGGDKVIGLADQVAAQRRTVPSW